MYDFMFIHHVGKVWYRLYWAYITLASLFLVVVYFVQKAIPPFNHFGLPVVTSSVLILCLAQIIYGLSIYWLIYKRSDALATFIGGMLFVLVIVSGLNGSGLTNAALLYIIYWLVVIVFSAMFGVLISAGAIFLPIVFVLSQYNFQIRQPSAASIVLVVGSAVCTFIGYLFWRTRFDDQQTKAVSRLSTMLRSNQQQSEILIQSIADGIIVIDTEGKITLMNTAAGRMTEWPVDEASDVDVRLVVKLHKEHGEELTKSEDPFSLALQQQQHISRIVELMGRVSKKQIVSLVISPILLPKANELAGAVAVIRDVSQEHAIEQQRADFISTAAHEMRTPVAAIEGYLSLALNERVSSVDNRARGYLQKAHASTQHLGKLFQDLLTSSKAEDGRLSSHSVVVEMGAFLQQLTDEFRLVAQKKGLAVEYLIGTANDRDIENDKETANVHMVRPLYYALVDPERIREVMSNLFDNACKYTQQGKISIGITSNEEVIQIYVRDTGSGIPAEDLPHLFQKFYRVDNSATRTIGGTGLGLFICRKIVELYKGRIWVESTLGKGSTFFINLPRLSTQKAVELQHQSTSPATPSTLQ
ncbi:MAG TPA: ATP-binding protein [Candidatus Saccharimonadales bacterium]|nr:ATP-binding protein [Candidatus Saccharimonadales bacterium]